MRLSGWFVGLSAFILLLLGTGLCAVVGYNGMRTFVVDSWERGLRIDQPGDILAALTNPDAILEEPTPTDTGAGESVVVIPSITPVATAAGLITPQSVTVESTPEPSDTDQSEPVAQAAPPTPTIEPTPDLAAEYTWNDPRQIRILLLGIDERRGFTTERAYRTDTMIVVNVDPVRNTAGVISFPRDLWVKIPNFEPQRINAANYIGDNVAYPGGGGPALAMETIAANFGIDVNYYVTVNFTVFETVVDTLAPGGVEVCPAQAIRDEKYPDEGFGTMLVEFPSGCQRLNGERLLQYARTRATQGGDFDRAARQQEVLEAVRREVLNLGGIANFLTQIPRLWEELRDSYRTNLSLEQLIALGFKLNDIPAENITYAVVNTGFVTLGTGPEGEQILHPSYTRISGLIQQVLYPQIRVDQGDLRARADAEAAPIYLYNGTSIAGLAARTQEWFINRQLQVAGLDNAPEHNGQPTVVRYYGGAADTARYVAEVMGLSPDRVEAGGDGQLTGPGVVVILGPDVQGLLGGG